MRSAWERHHCAFQCVFSSIQNPLTDPMRTAFSYVVRLLITIPNANITSLRKLLEDNPKGGYEQEPSRTLWSGSTPRRATSSDEYFTERVEATRNSILQRRFVGHQRAGIRTHVFYGQ